MTKQILARGKFLNLMISDGWEFAERSQSSGVVVIVPRLADGRWLFIEQYREPVSSVSIEFPAGLAGDSPEDADESLSTAASRELLEETGFRANHMQLLGRAAPTAGLTSEIMTFFLATQLVREHAGGGVGSEQIITHMIEDQHVDQWLVEKSHSLLISSMVYSGLYLARSRH